MKLNLELITREAGRPLLLWIRLEECGRESNSAIIQLIQGFKWVTEPCSVDQYTPIHSKTGAGLQSQPAGSTYLTSASEVNNVIAEVCTRGSRKPILLLTWVNKVLLFLLMFLPQIKVPSSTLGGSRKVFFTCLDPSESKILTLIKEIFTYVFFLNGLWNLVRE